MIGNIIIGAAADFDSSTYAKKDFSAYKYYADYDNEGSIGEWTVSDVSTSTGSDDEHGLYAKMVIDSSKSGNRNAYLDLGNKIEDLTDYTIETDVALSTGNVNERSSSQFLFLDTDAVISGAADTFTDNYIMKLHTDTFLSADPATATTWYVNDTENKITLEKNSWYHIKAYVNVTGGTTALTITDAEGEEVCSTDISNHGNGVLGRIYALLGRGSGALSIDNIKVYEGSSG